LFSLLAISGDLTDLTETEDFDRGLEAQAVGLPNFSRARLLISSSLKSRRFEAGDSIFFGAVFAVVVVGFVDVAAAVVAF